MLSQGYAQLYNDGHLQGEHDKSGPAAQEAKPGNKVGVRYKGWLAKNNKVFDQTKGSKTFNFRVGAALGMQ